MTKPFWQSWTIWANVLFVLGLVLQAVGQHYVFSLEVQAVIIAVANFLLRFKTNSGVSIN